MAALAVLLPLAACTREYTPDGDLKRPLSEFPRLVAKPLQIDPALAAHLSPEDLACLQKVADAFPKQLNRRLILRRILDAPEGRPLTLEGRVHGWECGRDAVASQRQASWESVLQVSFSFSDDQGALLGTGRGSVSVGSNSGPEEALKSVGNRLGVAVASYLKRTLKGGGCFGE